MKVTTSEIIKELEKKGIKYSQYNARIKWVADRLEIKPVEKIKKEWAYTKTDSNKIIKWITRGYNGKRGKKPQITIKQDKRIKFLTNKIKDLEEENQDYWKWIGEYKDAIVELNDRLEFTYQENEKFRSENEKLRKELEKLTEKKRKFWFFK